MSVNEKLDEIEARVEAATEGPWDFYDCFHHIPNFHTFSQQGVADGEFIAHARTDLPATTKALRKVLSLVNDWNEKGGAGSHAENVFGKQVISVGHIHTRITDAITEAFESGTQES